MDYDADRITYTNQNLVGPGQEDDADDGKMSAVEAKRQFREFIRSYRDGNLFPYRDQVCQAQILGRSRRYTFITTLWCYGSLLK